MKKMTEPKPNWCYLDTETTGLNPDIHEIWEVGLIHPVDVAPQDGGGWEWRQRVWQLPVDLGLAEPVALKIGRFYERRMAPHGLTSLPDFAGAFEKLTRGLHLIGAVISFDSERLGNLLRSNGACPGWHYHVIDIEAMVAGFLLGRGIEVTLPYSSDQLSRDVGVLPEKFEKGKHTALGDCLWVKAQHDAIIGARTGGLVV